MPDVAVPPKPRLTVTACPDTADSVAVTVTEPPLSGRSDAEDDSVTAGPASSSTIVATTCCTPDSAPLATESMSTTTVSPASSSASSTPVSVTVPLVEPAATTIEFADAM